MTSVIVAGARTPIGRLLGGLTSLSAADLGAIAIKGALEKAGVTGEQVDYVIMGQVIQAGAGQNPARSASVGAGIPMNVPTITINKVCLSGLNAIALADQLIRAGEVDIVVAGGMESMTNAPHFLPKSREGIKFGDVKLVRKQAHTAAEKRAETVGFAHAPKMQDVEVRQKIARVVEVRGHEPIQERPLGHRRPGLLAVRLDDRAQPVGVLERDVLDVHQLTVDQVRVEIEDVGVPA